MVFVSDAERAYLVGAEDVVTSRTRDAGEVSKNVLVEVEARRHEASNSTLPRSARWKP
mgnify:CR=1 FL=1